MSTVTLPENIMQMLDIVPGETAQDKIMSLLVESAASRLRECDARILELETKYGMGFAEFEREWKSNKIASKYSYPVEKDYMEWEGFQTEKKQWLAILRDFRGRSLKG